MVGMMLWEPSGHWTRPVTLKEVSVLHIRFLCARMAQDRRRNPLTERRRLRTAGKKLLRQRVEQVVLPAGASAEALPEGLDRGQLLSVLWRTGALRPGQVSVQLGETENKGAVPEIRAFCP